MIRGTAGARVIEPRMDDGIVTRMARYTGSGNLPFTPIEQRK
ncbi:MAG TPA: hypothetical protein VNJ12_10085 [Candidatus Dormibacteraeota bacterium]|nr:hypothetical protein [Candidatus Dormibacteraeota bacterium]